MLIAGIMGEQASDQPIQDLQQKLDFVRQRVQKFIEIANAEAMGLPLYCFLETKKTEMLRRLVSQSWAGRLATGVTVMLDIGVMSESPKPVAIAML